MRSLIQGRGDSAPIGIEKLDMANYVNCVFLNVFDENQIKKLSSVNWIVRWYYITCTFAVVMYAGDKLGNAQDLPGIVESVQFIL